MIVDNDILFGDGDKFLLLSLVVFSPDYLLYRNSIKFLDFLSWGLSYVEDLYLLSLKTLINFSFSYLQFNYLDFYCWTYLTWSDMMLEKRANEIFIFKLTLKKNIYIIWEIIRNHRRQSPHKVLTKLSRIPSRPY